MALTFWTKLFSTCHQKKKKKNRIIKAIDIINTEGWELRFILKTVHILNAKKKERELRLIVKADSHTLYNSQIR